MSQEELAKKAGVSRGTIQAAEAGHSISIGNLLKIADALGCHPANLFATAEDIEKTSAQVLWLLQGMQEALEKMRSKK